MNFYGISFFLSHASVKGKRKQKLVRELWASPWMETLVKMSVLSDKFEPDNFRNTFCVNFGIVCGG